MIEIPPVLSQRMDRDEVAEFSVSVHERFDPDTLASAATMRAILAPYVEKEIFRKIRLKCSSRRCRRIDEDGDSERAFCPSRLKVGIAANMAANHRR